MYIYIIFWRDNNMSKSESLLKLRNKLEFIRESKIPTNRKYQKPHELLVAEALSYLYELDEVENILDYMYVDNYIVIDHYQFEDLISQRKHRVLHFGKYVKCAEITIANKHHFFIATTPIAEL